LCGPPRGHPPPPPLSCTLEFKLGDYNSANSYMARTSAPLLALMSITAAATITGGATALLSEQLPNVRRSLRASDDSVSGSGRRAEALPGAPTSVGSPTTEYTRLATLPSGNMEGAGVWHNGELWTMGGFPCNDWYLAKDTTVHVWDAASNVGTGVWRYNPVTDVWAPGPPMEFYVHHSLFTATSLGNRIVYFGGVRAGPRQRMHGLYHER
jgi:hypothetical protein